MAFCVIYKNDSQFPPRFERCMTKLQGVQVRQIMQREASMEISNIAIAIRHQIGSEAHV